MQTPHILIVEDELVTRNTLKSIFEAEGYDVFEATDARKCIRSSLNMTSTW
ncbi:aerobic respiration control protein ArcA [Escherichia coli]|nr:aerobic respiration control protein ArcA [Escherichia coli]